MRLHARLAKLERALPPAADPQALTPELLDEICADANLHPVFVEVAKACNDLPAHVERRSAIWQRYQTDPAFRARAEYVLRGMEIARTRLRGRHPGGPRPCRWYMHPFKDEYRLSPEEMAPAFELSTDARPGRDVD